MVTIGLRFGIGLLDIWMGAMGRIVDCRRRGIREIGKTDEEPHVLLIEPVCANGNMSIRGELVPLNDQTVAMDTDKDRLSLER